MPVPWNQAAYPQSSSQAEGLGFPVMRVVALLSLATTNSHATTSLIELQLIHLASH